MAILASPSATRLALPHAFSLPRAGLRFIVRLVVAIEVLGLDVRDVEKAIAADREVDKPGLNGRLEVNDPALVNIARVALVAGSFHVKFFEYAVFDDGDSAFLGLKHVDQHFFLHAVSFQDRRRRVGGGLNLGMNGFWVGLVW